MKAYVKCGKGYGRKFEQKTQSRAPKMFGCQQLSGKSFNQAVPKFNSLCSFGAAECGVGGMYFGQRVDSIYHCQSWRKKTLNSNHLLPCRCCLFNFCEEGLRSLNISGAKGTDKLLHNFALNVTVTQKCKMDESAYNNGTKRINSINNKFW